MAAEEDKKFDAVLGGFLVNDLRVRAGHLHCPESDVLAAYHERSLLPEEMNSWKEHIVGCARCQAILAELKATDSIPLQVSEKEAAALEDAAMPVAVAREDRSAPPPRVPGESRVGRISRGVRWLWLAPAGALAAGLLVWVAWHENQPQVKAPPEVKMTKVEPPSTQEPPATQQAPASPSADQLRADQVAGFSKNQDAIGGIASAKKTLPAENLRQFEKLDSRSRTTPAKPSTDKEAAAGHEFRRDSALAADRSQNEPAQDAKAGVPAAVTQTVEVQTSAAGAPVQNELTQQTLQNQSAQKTPGPSPHAPEEQTKKAKSGSPARDYPAALPPPQPASASTLRDITTSAGLIAGAPNLDLVAAPGRKILWLVGHGGLLEFSSDGGASWSRQTSNVLVDLTSGSAPSDKVCWIVGRAGTILLTTDAGSHWAIVHSPLEEDLGGVRAADALHATIWNSLSTKTFATSDSGVTWKPVPPQ